MLKNLWLERSLASIDVETTGLLHDDPRIVEIAVVRVHPNLSVDALVRRVHPGILIPAAATAIHGITDRDVADCPPWPEVWPEIRGAIVGCDLCGFNVLRYDLPVLDGELRRIGLVGPDLNDRAVLDAMTIFHAHHHPARGTGTLSNACRRYLLGSSPAAHGALSDALAALYVLDAQVDRHKLPGRVPELAAWMAGEGVAGVRPSEG